MGYIAKAYVRATPIVIAKMLVWLEDAGHCVVSRQPRKIICIDDGMIYTIDKLTQDDRDNLIDCNSYTSNRTEEAAVALFLELAQMRDDEVVGQWVEHTDKVDVSYYRKPFKATTDWGHHLCHKLTPLMLASEVRAGNIELNEIKL